ncbi:MAG TPA: hypothetical protein VK581_02935, partial [Chthoniobacterales bacterium]|nr:hypothetical protein [Chthoniobacterales bacterium]
MKRKRNSLSGLFNPRVLLAFALCAAGMLLATFGFTGMPSRLAGCPGGSNCKEGTGEPQRFMPVPGGEVDDLDRMEEEWAIRLSYPTGKFDPAWVRQAAAKDFLIQRRIPLGLQATNVKRPNAPLAFDLNGFIALGPQPERMTGCAGCYDYGTTQGRVNAVAVDPTTTTNGSIAAYIGTVGGGVWKTTNCCSGATNWTALTDDAL